MLLTSTDTPLYRKACRIHPDHFGFLVTIRKYGIPGFLPEESAMWAADNDCYNEKLRPRAFMEWLKTLTPFANRCLFVAAPDIVADARATLRRFPHWHDSIRGIGLPVALCLQDGMTSRDIPWTKLDAVFVGGSTEWKMSPIVIDLLKEAGERELWRHVGRVNSFRRMFHFWDFADSFDGTGFAIEPDGKLRAFKPRMLARARQGRLIGCD